MNEDKAITQNLKNYFLIYEKYVGSVDIYCS